MTKNEFRQLFLRALDAAAQNTEERMGEPLPHSFLIELHAPESPGRQVGVEEALDKIYLGSDRFFRIIDVAIKELLSDKLVAFVRVSGHQPDEFGKTWDPVGTGPFKQIVAAEIVDHRIHSG